jgi:hypothetical protein
LPRCSLVRTTVFSFSAWLLFHSLAVAAEPGISLEVRPKVCTLPANSISCATVVNAHWRAAQPESVCLTVADRPEIKQCWDQYTEGTYSVQLEFNTDLVIRLQDPALEQILTSATLRIIREAVRYRQKRRQPWNIFY